MQLTGLLNIIVKMTEKKNNTEQAILEAAKKMFAEKGFKGATTTLIAAEAGVTHAMLHYYFRTKEQIFIKVAQDYVHEMRESLKLVMDDKRNFKDVVCEAVGTIYDFFLNNRGKIAVFMEVAREKPELLKICAQELSGLAHIRLGAHAGRFEQAAKEGVINDISFPAMINDIVLVTAFAVMYVPVQANIMELDESQIQAARDERRREAVELIRHRVFTSKQ